MKFTVTLISLLSISTSWAVMAKRVEDQKDKREAPVGYPSSGQSSHSYQVPSLGHGDASAINVAAGYSIGGAKPSYSFSDQGSSGAQQYQFPSEGLQSGGHSIQLAPITLQAGHGGIVGNDLSQIMSQLSQGINSGAISLTPSNSVAEYHLGNAGAQGGQEISLPQYSYPKFQQYQLSEPAISAPSYSAGTKGLSSYGTGPVLFNPSQAQAQAQGHAQGQSGQSAALSYGQPSAAHSFGDLSGFSLGGAGGQQYALAGLPQGISGHSFGGSFKNLGGSFVAPSKNTFKPSAYLGSSVQGDSGHGSSGLSGLSGSYSAPSFGNANSLSLGSGSHGASFGGAFGGFGSGATKYLAPSYQSPKSEGFGSNLESVSAFASSGHLASPPGTTYGIPSVSYSGHSSNNAHAASSASPQYYISSSKHSSPSSFGEGSSQYRAPVSSHSSLNSYSSGPKYSFGGHGSSASRYSAPKDSHGAHSETSYNTIKYSEELKPVRNH